MNEKLKAAYARLEDEERRSRRMWAVVLGITLGALGGGVGGAITLAVMVFVFNYRMGF